jgi:copper oxidase (laccase) domain-containing protein
LGRPPDELIAWLGPAIGQNAFEVGPEVRAAFVARAPPADRWFAPNPRGRWQADLYGLARDALAESGVRSVHGGGFCTYTESERFFSHRREAPCGRMAALVWIDADL